MIDPELDRIVEVNPKALEMLEYSAEEILATPVSEIHPREMDKLQAFASKVAEHGAAVTDVLTCTTKSGTVIPTEISASSLSIDGRPLMLAMVRDISERKRTQAILQEAHDSLEDRVLERTAELILAKSELEKHQDHLEELIKERTRELAAANDEMRSFIYIVSHDMRAPLVNIKGFASELGVAIGEINQALAPSVLKRLEETSRRNLEEQLHEEVPAALRFIETSADKLDRQINAILKLSRLGYREFKPEPVALARLVRDILNNLAHQLELTHARISIEDLPEVVADRFALEQILGNLLDNAVKYLDEERRGEITVSAERHAHETILHVQDNGRGTKLRYTGYFNASARRTGRAKAWDWPMCMPWSVASVDGSGANRRPTKAAGSVSRFPT